MYASIDSRTGGKPFAAVNEIGIFEAEAVLHAQRIVVHC